MAHRHRDILPTIVDRENQINVGPSKANLVKQPSLTRRPALNELSNKLEVTKHNATKNLLPSNKTLHPSKQEKNIVKAYSSVQLDTAVPETQNDDPQMVSEYLGDIFQYLRELETKYPIKEKFLEGHLSTPKMRTILVNWLVEVHSNFGLCLETLHMCVSLIDRYLQDNRSVGRDSLQLVGTGALYIACKYEEMYMPELIDFEYICDNSFTKKQILDMEMSILISLDCSLGKPLSIHFLRRYSKVAQVRLEQHNLSKYLLELALLDYNMAYVKPSLQAAAACCFSLAVLNNQVVSCPSKVWTSKLVTHTTYNYSEFKHVVIQLTNLLLAAESSKHKAIYKKYADVKYSKISVNPKLKSLIVKRLVEGSSKK